METVTVVNRTNRPLNAVFDGEDYVIPVGESLLPKHVVPYAKRQNPVMGSMDPHRPQSVQFLLGVKGTKDPITPVKEDGNAIELIDRSEMPGVAHRIAGKHIYREEVVAGPGADNVAVAMPGD
jgi:hypothetical protein